MLTDWEWLFAGVDRVWAPVATPLGSTLALLVTGHALLRKRDVPACLGWIGLAWVAPVWGALFYYLLGINRVTRRALQVRGARPPRHHQAHLPTEDFAGHLAPLDQAVRRITNRPAENDNAVTMLANGDAAFPAMLEAIAAARHSVALSTYIMRDDAVGHSFAAALADAKARGVAVRVLLDGIGSGYFPGIARRLRQAGLPVALFMHSALPWRMPFLNLRSHKKLLVCDGTVGFTGGMNVTAESLLGGHPRHPVADTHFRLEGPVVAQLADAFARDWSFTTRESLDGPVWFPPGLPHEAERAVARVIASGPDHDLEKIELVMLQAVSCATHSIRIMTPYFVPPEGLVTALTLAALRGVDVEIVVPRRSNKRFVDLAMQAHVQPLLDHGVRFWYGHQPFNHSKLMVVDRRWCLIGSANWDMRSLRLNFELDVEVYGRPLADEIESLMRACQDARLRPQDLAARNVAARLRDAALRLLLPYI
ncbi:phospholipase D-like domain-containing protein [Lichenihabitans sp. Uapishka_5]|uniref:phospholipase D-like domain-containing protein n=1 Tax=Lichenihabitans sp. Uapishka_5 TaxID=3037302 RepID=UPI0029E81C2B|nr:phospholipase D-like domain-containing protein [Lichenihabitans sp. Uapishka_5]MDX7952806.1 phospholipase D-like domain-containing protein [Lichenihabitans sp. Uapishka_5]